MIPERQAGPCGWRPCANCKAVASVPPGGDRCVLCYQSEDRGPSTAALVELADRMNPRLAALLDPGAALALNLVELAELQAGREAPEGVY